MSFSDGAQDFACEYVPRKGNQAELWKSSPSGAISSTPLHEDALRTVPYPAARLLTSEVCSCILLSLMCPFYSISTKSHFLLAEISEHLWFQRSPLKDIAAYQSNIILGSALFSLPNKCHH